jgi:hypothetical protein
VELNKIEVESIEKVVSEANEGQIRELSELQLVLIGGGIGDVVFH